MPSNNGFLHEKHGQLACFFFLVFDVAPEIDPKDLVRLCHGWSWAIGRFGPPFDHLEHFETLRKGF